MTVLTYPIVGAFYRKPADVLLNNLPIGAVLFLRRDPDNPVDVNAIAVWLPQNSFPNQNEDIEQAIQGRGWDVVEFYSWESFHVGFLPKEVAAKLVSKIPVGKDIPGIFSVSPTGKPQIRFDEL